MANIEQFSGIPQEVLLATDISSEQTEQIATFLAGNDMIQLVTTPSIDEWRAGSYCSVFLRDPIPHPLISIKILMTYARVLHGPESTFDLLLKSTRLPGGIPSYPDRQDFQGLILLKHGEATMDELLGKTEDSEGTPHQIESNIGHIRQELKAAQARAVEKLARRDSISVDSYIIGIDFNSQIPDSDIAILERITNNTATPQEIGNWVNSVDQSVSDEATALGMDKSGRDYAIFFNQHPRERFVSWVKMIS